MSTPPTTLVELIDHGAANWPDLPMLLARQGDTATYAEYKERVEVMAAGFADMAVWESNFRAAKNRPDRARLNQDRVVTGLAEKQVIYDTSGDDERIVAANTKNVPCN